MDAPKLEAVGAVGAVLEGMGEKPLTSPLEEEGDSKGTAVMLKKEERSLT